MRNEQVRAIASLRAISKALSECAVNHKDRRTALLIRLGRLLKESPLISGALAELAEDKSEALRIENALTALHRMVDASLQRMADLLPAMTDKERHAIMRAEEAPLRFFAAHLRKATNRQPTGLSTTDVQTIATEVLRLVREKLATAVKDEDGAAIDFLDELEDFCSNDVKKLATAVHDASVIDQRLSIRTLVSRLCGYAERWESFLEKHDVTHTLIFNGIEHDVHFLIDLLESQIESGISGRYAIYRLRTYFEHFHGKRLRDDLAVAEKSADRADRERILQEAMDAFMFHEGFYPVIHSAVSRGFLDTLLLDAAESSTFAPLLIELKQAVDIENAQGIRRSDVAGAISDAEKAISLYRNHVLARARWHKVTPTIIVVHSCREAVCDLESEHVYLIDLCDRTPSEKMRARAASAAQTLQ